MKEFDSSHLYKRKIKKEIYDALTSAEGPHIINKTQHSFEEFERAVERTTLDDLLEFGRMVHAEMAALMDAARRGISVKGCLMYVTTFPCHMCARHIIAAGIQKVIYIEPYPKSKVGELYEGWFASTARTDTSVV